MASAFKTLRCMLLVLSCLAATSCGILPGNDKSAVVDSSEVRRLLGEAVAAEEAGDIPGASERFEQMMDRGARSAGSLNRYAVFLRRQWDIDAAEAIYLRALKNEPGHASTHYNLGILYELYRGDLGSAQVHFKKYLAAAGDAQESDQRLVKAWIKDIDRRIASNAQPTRSVE